MFEGQPRSMPESTDEGMSAVKVAADWECEWWTEHSVPGPRHAAPVSVSAKAIKEIQLVPLGTNYGNTQLQLDIDCIRYNKISLGAGGSLPLLIQVINSQIIKVLKTVICKQTEIKLLFLK